MGLFILSWSGMDYAPERGVSIVTEAQAQKYRGGIYRPYRPYTYRPMTFKAVENKMNRPRPPSIKEQLLSSTSLTSHSSFKTHTNRVLKVKNNDQRLMKLGAYKSLAGRIKIDRIATRIGALAKGDKAHSKALTDLARTTRTLNTDQIGKANNIYKRALTLAKNSQEATKSVTRTKKVEPIKDASGPHTTWKADPQTGQITRHETWKPNPRNPTGWDKGQSTDLRGAPHINKQTGEAIPTPHTQGKGIPGGVRPANPSEIPKGNHYNY